MAGLIGTPLPRRLLAALAISLLLHLWLTGVITLPSPVAVVEAPPIEARLVGTAVEPAPPAPAPKPPALSPKSLVQRPAQPQARPVLALPEPSAVEPTAPGAAPVVTMPPVAASEPSPAAEKPPAEPALPEGFKIRFLVQGNEGGLVLGQLDHVWRRTGDRYSLVGIARATGLFALFYSGLLSQTSDGRITPEGLQPNSYWLLRGKKSYTALFDWDRSAVRLGGPYGSLALPPGAQDYLSVVYQVALFPRAESGRVVVVSGKRAKEYRYQELGREVIRLPLGEMETIHLRIGQGGEEDDMEVWLRAAPPQLPVKMHLIDNKGRTGVLLAEAIE